jgi:hypothetical protein
MKLRQKLRHLRPTAQTLGALSSSAMLAAWAHCHSLMSVMVHPSYLTRSSSVAPTVAALLVAALLSNLQKYHTSSCRYLL